MNIFVSICLISLSFFIYARKRKIYYPAFIICILYSLIMFFEIFGLYDLNRSNAKTYLIILFGVFSFCVGAELMQKVRFYVGHQKCVSDQEHYVINYKLFKVLLLFAIIMSLYPAYMNFIVLLSSESSLSIIREDFGTYYNSNILNLIYNYIVNPTINASLALSAVAVFDEIENYQKVQIFIMECILIVLNVIMNAGRGILLYFMIMVFFAYKIETNDAELIIGLHKKKKYKLFSAFVFVVAIVGYIAVSKYRGGSSSNAFLKQVYVYACGCVPHLDYRINQIDEANICLYGTGGAHGLFQFVFTMLENFGIMTYPHIMNLSDYWYNNALSYVSIGPTIAFNAYATLFYNAYLDGGFFAVIFELFLYGAISGNLFDKVECNKSDKRFLVIFIYILYGICFSFVRFQFTLHCHWLAILLLVLLTKKQEGVHYENYSN